MNQLPSVDVLTIGREQDNQIVLNEANISRKHARLIICSSTSFLLEDLESKHGTYVNGLRISRKIIGLKDEILFATNKYTVEYLLKPQAQPIVEKTNPLDFTKEFADLEKVWEDYPSIRKNCRNKDKLIRIWSIAGASVVSVGAFITHEFTLMTLSSAGLGMLVPTLASTLLSTEEKLELIDKEFKEKYRCPNPECHEPFGNREWKLWAKQKKCNRCKAIWVNEQ